MDCLIPSERYGFTIRRSKMSVMLKSLKCPLRYTLAQSGSAEKPSTLDHEVYVQELEKRLYHASSTHPGCHLLVRLGGE